MSEMRVEGVRMCENEVRVRMSVRMRVEGVHEDEGVRMLEGVRI